ncbi:hypothetical protein BDP81DRAFT_395372 [Colletotrichum phormii]|uniref:Avirulence Effector AvrLm4-7 domain-containing protein n=1 Tax=Colletotrichum phormii TaxID=359342 RepID=A0AAI9ZQ88_9PEZI|nr:uncharacterized protein BDP81DRAFT_395372 [Colletotrichum phormii]KAK1635826.1 hypothetical protein BDP81DRAFT_395372 [Colletotrichum phormii]
MKLNIQNVLLSLLVFGSVTTAKDPKTHPGWKIPDENEVLPIHELPDCYQECFGWNHNKIIGVGDVFKMSRRQWCDDDWGTVGTWWTYHMNFCTADRCTDEKDGIKGFAWNYKLCGFLTRGEVDEKDD